MKIINTRVEAYPLEGAPVDFYYIVEREILLDNEQTIFIQVYTSTDDEVTFLVNTASAFKKEYLDTKPLEFYNSLNKAKKSSYKKLFIESYKLLNEEIDDVMKKLDDTAYFDGIRFGACYDKGLKFYNEGVIHLSKLDKFIYIQITQINGKNHYTVTDISIFLRMDMGFLYDSYYPNSKDPVYLVDTYNLDELGEYEYLKEDFIDISDRLEKAIKKLREE